MNAQRVGVVIAVLGAVYLVAIGWTSSWWYVPALTELGARAFVERTPWGGTAFNILWGCSGVLGAIIVALGAALAARVGTLRWLLLAAGAAALIAWLVLWSASSRPGAVFGVGGGLILLAFLVFCFDWVGARRKLEGAARTAADLRLAANLCFFVTAWGLCGLLGAPIFLLQTEIPKAAGAGSTMAVKVLVCLVLGWALTAAAQRVERRGR